MTRRQILAAAGLILLLCCAAGCGRKPSTAQPAASRKTNGPQHPPDQKRADRDAAPPKSNGQRIAETPAKGVTVDEKATGDALTNGVAFLMSRQAEDGGWHSRTSGALRGGAATTALALYAAAHLPPDVHKRYRHQLERGYQFLQPGIRKNGLVCCPDGTLDYPNYASAMTITAVGRLKLDAPAEELARLAEYLIGAQLGPQRGFAEDSPHFGGWDLMGASGVHGMTSGTNVSVTCFAVEALRTVSGDDAAAARQRARKWVEGCQNFAADGGFVFHPDPSANGNKAQWHDDQRTRARSYGTCTCDGVRILIDCGAKRSDPRIAAGIVWVGKHPKVDVVPGFEEAPPALGWREGLRFYYYATLAKTLVHLPAADRSKLRQRLTAAICGLQRAAGSWRNDSARMREDDPLIATCLALVALGEIARLDQMQAAKAE